MDTPKNPFPCTVRGTYGTTIYTKTSREDICLAKLRKANSRMSISLVNVSSRVAALKAAPPALHGRDAVCDSQDCQYASLQITNKRKFQLAAPAAARPARRSVFSWDLGSLTFLPRGVYFYAVSML